MNRWECPGIIINAVVLTVKTLRNRFKQITQLYFPIITGRNEVLAKVIFSQASVIHSVHRGGLQFFGGLSKFSKGEGVSNFLGGLQIWGVSKFSGGLQIFGEGGWFLQIFWGVSKFLGGLQFFRGGFHRNTVNVRPVRILLECILVLLFFSQEKFQMYTAGRIDSGLHVRLGFGFRFTYLNKFSHHQTVHCTGFHSEQWGCCGKKIQIVHNSAHKNSFTIIANF